MIKEQIIEIFKNNSLAHSIGLNSSGYLVIKACLDEWEKPHRFYHGLNHLYSLLKDINELDDGIVWEKSEIDKMEILALWHDVIYNPRNKNNEEDSIKFIMSFSNILDLSSAKIKDIFEAIRYTKYQKELNFMNLKSDNFIRMFCHLDIGKSCEHNFETLSYITNREVSLIKEFQYVNYQTYKENRINFIKNFPYFKDSEITIDFLSNYRPKIGVYPGSFNPFHIGHLNILEQAEKIFDKVIIVQGNNPDKKMIGNRWTPHMILPFHEVVQYDGLLSNYLKSIDYADVTVIRGLRNGYDLEYETNQLRILEDYGCKLPVIYFICSKETAHISSSMIRGLSTIPNSGADKYIPKKYNYYCTTNEVDTSCYNLGA